MGHEAKRTRGGGDVALDTKRERLESKAPDVSVLMPCRNAMPWLPDCVSSVLAQEGLTLELLVVDDGSTDGSREWLEECEDCCLGIDAGLPADAQCDQSQTPARSSSDGGGDQGWVAAEHVPATAAQVARASRPGNSIRVFSVEARGPSGQGLALNLALRHARGEFIGEMESDDLRPPDAFATLVSALREDPTLDAVVSEVELVGWPREGMQRYIQWQNSQRTPEELARSRFVEIPALRASGLYRKECMLRLGGYRDLWMVDGSVADFATSNDHLSFLRSCGNGQAAGDPEHVDLMATKSWWPVDSDFWMRFFALGCRCKKVPRPLYRWRQYPAQSTRTHSRCSLEQLRACKIHFIGSLGGPLHEKRCQVWSVGTTLEAWGKELAASGVEVELVSWKPGTPVPRGKSSRKDGCVRVFVYGSDKARQKVRQNKDLEFDEAHDWFAA